MQHSYNSYFTVFDNSSCGHHGVGMCWFSFLLRISHIFLILSMSGTFILYPGNYEYFIVKLWVLFIWWGSCHRSVLPSVSGSSNVSSFFKSLCNAALDLYTYVYIKGECGACAGLYTELGDPFSSYLSDYLCSSAHRDPVLALWGPVIRKSFISCVAAAVDALTAATLRLKLKRK